MINKKKLKEEYKNIVPPKGVFVIRNKKTGKVFLGSSLNLKNQFEQAKIILNMGNHLNSALQSDWIKFGEDNFEYEVLETLEIKQDSDYNYSEDLEILEMLWIDKYKPFSEKCYNKNEKIRIV
ncbi:MAG: GIY-YIG nuclease family protein [FCB group bacterium]|jgi:group I intron endonuclease